MTRLSPVTWLVCIAVVLIGTFVGSTILVESNLRRIDGHAAEIVDNAAPSITELAAARTEMRHLELGVGRYLGAHTAGIPIRHAQLDQWRAAVDDHLRAYERLPDVTDEHALRQRLASAKAQVYADADRAVGLVDQGRLPEARTLVLGTLAANAEQLDHLVERLIAVNNDQAATDARQMAALRQRTSALALLLDAVSVLLGAVLLLAAVRAARLYHRALDERRRLAEARAEELDHFASRVAHDLKAPLASVMLGTSVAAQFPEQSTRTLMRIQRTSRLMGQMIDALLAVARVEPEHDHPSATPVAPVLDILVEDLRPAAEAAKATLHVEPFAPTTAVACSSGILASVLSNLLQNAVKYIGDAAGERAIVVRVVEAADCVRFEVADTGPGLPPKLEEHVFEPYVKGEQSTGLGLGLATVKHLVESAGGRLGVSSVVGKGSCFWAELPRAAQPQQQEGCAAV